MKASTRELIRMTLYIAPLVSLLIIIAGTALSVMFGHRLLFYIGIASVFVVMFVRVMFSLFCEDLDRRKCRVCGKDVISPLGIETLCHDDKYHKGRGK